MSAPKSLGFGSMLLSPPSGCTKPEKKDLPIESQNNETEELEMPSDHSFVKTPPDELIHEIAMPLYALKGTTIFASGTAFLIGPRLALTAYHVFSDFLDRYEGSGQPGRPNSVQFAIQTFLTIDKGARQVALHVKRVWHLDPLDLAVLALEIPGDVPAPSNFVWKKPVLNLRPPRVGTPIAGFGFASSEVLDSSTLKLKPRTTSGEVVQIHHTSRDSVRLPFPCFRTNARFDGSMSGGPVFNNQTGEICGVICSGFETDEKDLDHLTYASTLWPSIAILLDIDPTDLSVTSPYPLLELIQSGICPASDVNCVGLQIDRSTAPPRCRPHVTYNQSEWDAV